MKRSPSLRRRWITPVGRDMRRGARVADKPFLAGVDPGIHALAEDVD